MTALGYRDVRIRVRRELNEKYGDLEIERSRVTTWQRYETAVLASDGYEDESQTCEKHRPPLTACKTRYRPAS